MGILSLLVRIGVDSTDFETGIKRVQSIGDKFGSSFKSAVSTKLGAALSVAAITGFSRSVISLGDHIDALSEQFNISASELQQLQALASKTGISLESFGSAIAKVNDQRTEAIKTDSKSRESFKSLGLSVADLADQNASSLDILIRVGKAIIDSGHNATVTAAAVDLLGLKLTKTAVAVTQFESLNDVLKIDDSTLKKLAQANFELEEAIRQLKVLAAPSVAKGASWLTNIKDQIDAAFEDVKKVKQNPSSYYRIGDFDLFGGLLDLAAPLTAIGGAFLGAIGVQRKKAEMPASAIEDIGPKYFGPSASTGRTLLPFVPSPFTLGGAQDPLARIGGFGAFSSGQSELIRQAIEQKNQLKGINRNTEQMAKGLLNA